MESNLESTGGYLVWFEPTDLSLASKPFVSPNVPFPKFVSPNYQEFQVMYKTLQPMLKGDFSGNGLDEIEECVKKGYVMAELIDNIIITLGKKGVMVIRKGEDTDPFFTTEGKPKYSGRGGPVSHRLYKCNLLPEKEIINVSGAGDCFASGFIAAMLKGESEKSCVEFGFKCSTASLKSSRTVPPCF